MFLVIFEVRPSESGYQQYLQTAAALRPQLDNIQGFLSIERFRSLERDGWILSLSKWGDEASLVKWRTTREHHEAQKAGRGGVFDDYRLRVTQKAAWVRTGEPEQERSYRTACLSAERAARFVSVLEVIGLDRAAVPLATSEGDSEWYESLTNSGKMAWVIGWRSEEAARQWHRQMHAMLDAMPGVTFELSLSELERDYGMFAREEAPQYYPPVSRPAVFE